MSKKQQPKELPTPLTSSFKNKGSFLSVINSNVEKDIILYERNITLDGTLRLPNIREISRSSENANKAILTAVTFLVMRANKKEAIYKEIEDDACFALAVDLIELFEYDTIQDISLMFKYSRTGKLKIDSMSKRKSFYQKVLNDYVPAYFKLKAELREELHEQNKKTFLPSSWTEENRKKLKDLIAEVTPEKRKGSEFIEKPSSLNNQDSFIVELKADAKRTSEAKLKDFIKRWSKDNGMKRYVHVLKDELKSRENDGIESKKTKG